MQNHAPNPEHQERMSEHVTSEIIDRIQVLRIQRPDKKNALTQAMYGALADALAAADADPQIRCSLITGVDEVFTSGNDIADFLKAPNTGNDSPVVRFLNNISTAKKPVVAAVNGLAIGVGVTMLLHCDLVYAAADARLQLPFVNIGICPEAASSLIMPRMMGHQRANELLLLGEMFDATTAHEFGMVNAVVPRDQLFEHAMDRCRRLAAQPPNALRTTKALLRRIDAEQIKQTMSQEFQTFAPMLQGPEALEAMGAFMQKRKPDFSKFD